MEEKKKAERGKQKSLPFPVEGTDGQCPRIRVTVTRRIQIGEREQCILSAGLDLPPDATPDQIEAAQTVQEVLLQKCWDTANSALDRLLLEEAHQASAPQKMGLIRLMHRLRMSEEDLKLEAQTQGIPWPEGGVSGLSFRHADMLMDVLVNIAEIKSDTVAVAPTEKGREAPLSLENVKEVPIERLFDLAIHFGRPWPEGNKGATLLQLWQDEKNGRGRLAWLARTEGKHWTPNPNREGKIDPLDRVLKVAASRVYDHQSQREAQKKG